MQRLHKTNGIFYMYMYIHLQECLFKLMKNENTYANMLYIFAE